MPPKYVTVLIMYGIYVFFTRLQLFIFVLRPPMEEQNKNEQQQKKMSKKNNLKKIVSRCTTNRCFVFHQLLHLRSLFKIQIDKDLSE